MWASLTKWFGGNINSAELYRFANKQSMLGQVADAILHHGDELKVPISQKDAIQWAGIYMQVANCNRLVNKRCADITRMFADEGVRTCVLKGQGNALMYPNPMSRQPGDIDLWVEGDRKRVKEASAKLGKLGYESYHHIDVQIFDDVTVEVHFTPSKLENPFTNRRWQRFVKEQSDRQFSHFVELPEQAGRMAMPTNDFNLLFQLTHIYRHFIVKGIGLRHFVDYYYLLRHEYTQSEKESFNESLRKLNLAKFAAGVMWIEQAVLGLESKYLLVTPCEQTGRLIMDDILKGGNFGAFNPIHPQTKENRIMRRLRDIRRNLALLKAFPSETISLLTYGELESQVWKIKNSFHTKE